MAAHTGNRRRGGFTVIEMMIVVAVLMILTPVLYTPIANGLAMANRENTQMNMFRSADIVMTRLASLLQPALLPVGIGPVPGSSQTGNDRTFRNVFNSAQYGMGRHAAAWRAALANGTDFIPFCTPIYYTSLLGGVNTRSMVDSEGLPVLGMTYPGGDQGSSATYQESQVDGTLDYRLGNLNINPGLAQFDPASYGLGGSPQPLTINDVRTFPRFAERLMFTGTDTTKYRGYAVVRFVPDWSEGPPGLLDEANFFGPGSGFDLNMDGTTADQFVRGAIRVDYANNNPAGDPLTRIQTQFPMAGQMVLLQLNSGGPNHKPLFRLGADGTTIEVNLLLFDETAQRGTPLATAQRGGNTFITRWYRSSIELRNMTLE